MKHTRNQCGSMSIRTIGRRYRAAVILLLLCGLAWCGCKRQIAGPTPPPAYAVTGKVLYEDGQPAVRAIVQFKAESDPNLNISAPTSEDGSFKLVTIHGNHRLDGTMEGRYRVTVTPPCKFTPDDMPRPIAMPQPCQVKPEANHFEFKIPRKK